MNIHDTYDAVYAQLGYQKNYTDEAIRSAIDIDAERQQVTKRSYFERTISLTGSECEEMLSAFDKDSLEELAEAIKQQVIATFRDNRHNEFHRYRSEADGPTTYSLCVENFSNDACEASLEIKGVNLVKMETDKEVIGRFRKALTSRAKKEDREKHQQQQQLDNFTDMISGLDLPESEKTRLIEQYKAEHLQ